MARTVITTAPGTARYGPRALGDPPLVRQGMPARLATLGAVTAGAAAADLRRRQKSDRAARAHRAAPESLAAARKADSDPPGRPV